MNFYSSSLLLLATLVLLSGCQSSTSETVNPADSRLLIGVSVTPQAWLVQRLGGERVEVLTVVGPAESPVTYQPTDVQVSRLLAADAFIRIGVPCEQGRWFAALAGSGKVEMVHQAELVGSLAAQRHPHGGDDPHIWLSPRLLVPQARTVTAALSRLDPVHAAEFRANLARLEGELEALDRTLEAKLAPLAGRPFFVFHPSWGHFAHAYGLRQVAIELDGKEPAEYQLTLLQQQARESAVRAIFVQPQIAGRSAEAVAAAVGARLVILDPMAPDVLANLMRVADELLAAYSLPSR